MYEQKLSKGTYPALRLFKKIYMGLGYLAIGLTVIFILYIAVIQISSYSSGYYGFRVFDWLLFFGATLLFGGVIALTFFALAQFIALMIELAENSRAQVRLLEAMTRQMISGTAKVPQANKAIPLENLSKPSTDELVGTTIEAMTDSR